MNVRSLAKIFRKLCEKLLTRKKSQVKILSRCRKDRTFRKDRKMENAAQDMDKIKSRISKLLKMAADSSSPEEAAIAAGRARKMMDAYQIDASQLGSVEEVFGTAAATPSISDLPQYMSTLAVAVAQYNDCQARYEYAPHATRPGEQGKIVQFLGYKSDTELAVEMFKRLSAAINRLCKEYLKEQGFEGYNATLGGQFKTGASSAIIAALKTMTEQRDLLTFSNGTALVVAKTKAVESHFGVVKYSSATSRRLTNAEQEARSVGYVRGAKVEITKRVAA